MAFPTTTSAYEMDGGYTPSVPSDSATSALNGAASQISAIKGIADYNSAKSAEQASIQREWQEQQNAKAMAFNREEAAKNRNWQEYMSNTAHQREIKDLQAAGLNPILSALNGNGASVTSGATASGVTSAGAKGDVDTSANSAIVNLLGTFLDTQNKLQLQNLNAINNLAVADKYTQMSQIVAEIGAAAGIQQAGIHAGATRYAADQSAAASRYSTDHTKYGMIGNGIDFISGLFGDSSAGSSSSAKGKSFKDEAIDAYKDYHASGKQQDKASFKALIGGFLSGFKP